VRVQLSLWCDLSQPALDADVLPIKVEGNDLFEKCGDGILLCKLINASVPGERLRDVFGSSYLRQCDDQRIPLMNS
jgi:hypothetical protein